MKNREKYENELMDVIKMDGRICGFVKKHDVFRMIGTGWESFCEMDCVACGTVLQIWLDEEYEVDWSKVPVDKLVRVRNDENGEWLLRYFCEWNGNTDHKYTTFPNGRTSKTATYYIENWRFCELVEVEVEDE
nr:MAG TPA_asm: hypothetical protein [Caudoviricetes sp.]